jgi:4-hydroxy-3-methylbut-2-en-1-yl diphosphate synthase IspG/GcpE
MSKKKSKTHEEVGLDLADMECIINGFLEESRSASEVMMDKYIKENDELKKKNKKLRKENKALEKENKELKEYYNRFDILDL